MGDERNAWSKPRSDIICLEGNGSRQSHRGGGYSTEGVMYTLNGTEVHAVCVYDARGNGGREVDSLGKKAGKGALWQTEKAGTVAAAQDQTLIQSL